MLERALDGAVASDELERLDGPDAADRLAVVAAEHNAEVDELRVSEFTERLGLRLRSRDTCE